MNTYHTYIVFLNNTFGVTTARSAREARNDFTELNPITAIREDTFDYMLVRSRDEQVNMLECMHCSGDNAGTVCDLIEKYKYQINQAVKGNYWDAWSANSTPAKISGRIPYFKKHDLEVIRNLAIEKATHLNSRLSWPTDDREDLERELQDLETIIEKIETA